MKRFLWQRNNWFIALSLLFLLVFSLAATMEAANRAQRQVRIPVLSALPRQIHSSS